MSIKQITPNLWYVSVDGSVIGCVHSEPDGHSARWMNGHVVAKRASVADAAAALA